MPISSSPSVCWWENIILVSYFAPQVYTRAFQWFLIEPFLHRRAKRFLCLSVGTRPPPAVTEMFFPGTKLSLQLCVFDIFSPKKQWHDTCQRRPQTEVWKLSSGLRQLLLPPLSHINTHIQTKTQRHTATSTLSQTWKHQQPRTLANSANDKVTLCLCPCLFTFTYLFRIFWIHIQHFLETCWIHQYCIFAIFVVLVEFIS